MIAKNILHRADRDELTPDELTNNILTDDDYPFKATPNSQRPSTLRSGPGT